MSLKKLLLLPLILSIVIFFHYSKNIQSSFDIVTTFIQGRNLAFAISLAAALQIIGHIIRSYKMRLLLSPVKQGTLKFQFRALSVGYLFNAILPLRLGELIRAKIIASGENISFGYAIGLVAIERALDAVLLGLVGLFLFTPMDLASSRTTYYGIFLLVLSAIFGLFVTLLIRQNLSLFRFWYFITRLFNDGIKNSLRFKAWSIIYGLQQTITKKRAAQYIGLSLLSWLFYFMSVFVIAQNFFPGLAPHYKASLSASPYYGVSVPAGPANLGVYSKVTNAYTTSVPLSPDAHTAFDLVSWAVLIGPISLLGLVFFFVKTKETIWNRRPRQASVGSLSNKLLRSEDISWEMSNFLENYFSGNTLSRIVHRLELAKKFHLLKYFKGGSDAITILALENDKEIVKKIIPPEFKDRLKAQYDWLKDRRGKRGIVEVLGEEDTPDYYAISLAYDPKDQMLFDYMHHNSIDKSQKVMDEVWGYLFDTIYRRTSKLALHEKQRDAYVDKHIFGCLDKAAAVYPELALAARPKKIIINGHSYDNLYQIIDKIKKHPKAWKDIATYRESEEVHGDVAIDNILVSQTSGKSLLIDPAPDGNLINGPVFDFGKNMQSLYCGYEFMLRDGDPVYLVEDRIDYRDHSSAQYHQLCDYVSNHLAKQRLSESERKAIIFHAGALHIRRLKHQVYYNPANTLKFYAVGVKTLNDFLAQYDSHLEKKRSGRKSKNYKSVR